MKIYFNLSTIVNLITPVMKDNGNKLEIKELKKQLCYDKKNIFVFFKL